MKSYNIDNKILDRNLIRSAIIKACKNKHKSNGKATRKYREAQYILKYLDLYTEKIYNLIPDFEPSEYCYFERKSQSSGKVRQIASVPLYPDQIVHQVLIESSKPVLMTGMYYYSCGSIPNRGVHYAKNYIQKFINRHRERNSNCIKYVAQLDIKKCYANIDHDLLKDALRKKFRGKLCYSLFCKIIDSYKETGTDEHPVGLPIGFYTSQWLCNFFLTPLDYFIKQSLRIKTYVRYMDDMVIFGGNKKELHKAVDRIIAFAAEMGLQIKDNWQVFRFDYISRKDGERKGRALDFLGYRFFRDKTILRKRLALSIRRTVLKISKSKRISLNLARVFMSKIGWLRHCNSFNFWHKYIKPFIKIKKIKDVIRNESRKHNYARVPV